MLEIYNEEYKDLLGKGPPAGKKHQVCPFTALPSAFASCPAASAIIHVAQELLSQHLPDLSMLQPQAWGSNRHDIPVFLAAARVLLSII